MMIADDANRLALATLLAVVPVAIVFLVSQRHFVAALPAEQ